MKFARLREKFSTAKIKSGALLLVRFSAQTPQISNERKTATITPFRRRIIFCRFSKMTVLMSSALAKLLRFTIPSA
jgi:hypothetical protein